MLPQCYINLCIKEIWFTYFAWNVLEDSLKIISPLKFRNVQRRRAVCFILVYALHQSVTLGPITS